MGNGKQQCRQDLSQATKSRLDFQQTSSWIDLQMWTSLLVNDPMIIRYYEYKQRDPMIIYMFHDYCMILDKLYYAYYRHRVPFSAGSGGLFHMNFTRCPKKGNPLDQKRQKQFLWSSIMSIKSWEESGLLDLFRQQRTTFWVDLESKGNLHFFWKKWLILSQDGYFFSPKSLSAKDFGRAFWCVLSHSN